MFFFLSQLSLCESRVKEDLPPQEAAFETLAKSLKEVHAKTCELWEEGEDLFANVPAFFESVNDQAQADGVSFGKPFYTPPFLQVSHSRETVEIPVPPPQEPRDEQQRNAGHGVIVTDEPEPQQVLTPEPPITYVIPMELREHYAGQDAYGYISRIEFNSESHTFHAVAEKKVADEDPLQPTSVEGYWGIDGESFQLFSEPGGSTKLGELRFVGHPGGAPTLMGSLGEFVVQLVSAVEAPPQGSVSSVQSSGAVDPSTGAYMEGYQPRVFVFGSYEDLNVLKQHSSTPFAHSIILHENPSQPGSGRFDMLVGAGGSQGLEGSYFLQQQESQVVAVSFLYGPQNEYSQTLPLVPLPNNAVILTGNLNGHNVELQISPHSVDHGDVFTASQVVANELQANPRMPFVKSAIFYGNGRALLSTVREGRPVDSWASYFPNGEGRILLSFGPESHVVVAGIESPGQSRLIEGDVYGARASLVSETVESPYH